MATIVDWVEMCAGTDEFVHQFNRLFGTKLNFRPVAVPPIIAMVDKACGHDRTSNDEAEVQVFVGHCIDLWFLIPEVQAKAGAA